MTTYMYTIIAPPGSISSWPRVSTTRDRLSGVYRQHQRARLPLQQRHLHDSRSARQHWSHSFGYQQLRADNRVVRRFAQRPRNRIPRHRRRLHHDCSARQLRHSPDERQRLRTSRWVLFRQYWRARFPLQRRHLYNARPAHRHWLLYRRLRYQQLGTNCRLSGLPRAAKMAFSTAPVSTR